MSNPSLAIVVYGKFRGLYTKLIGTSSWAAVAGKFDAFDPWLCALNVAIRLGYQLTCFLQYSVEELRIELLKEHFGCGKRKQ